METTLQTPTSAPTLATLHMGLVIAATYGGHTQLFWVPRDASCYAVGVALHELFGEAPDSMHIVSAERFPPAALEAMDHLTLREDV